MANTLVLRSGEADPHIVIPAQILFAVAGYRCLFPAPYCGETPQTAEELRRVCPVVAGFGELDKPFVEKGRRLERHLESLGVPHDVKFHPGGRHAYMNDHGLGPVMSSIVKGPPLYAAYDETAAEDSWRRMLAFFAEHL
jgi:carboxymethylenebutenolidase